MNRQIETDNRAWLTIDEPHIDLPLKAGYAMAATFKTKNLGKTPARLTGYFIRSRKAILGDSWHIGFPGGYHPPSVYSGVNITIAPNGLRELQVHDVEMQLTPEEEAALPSRGLIFVQFVLNYLDAFGKPHNTVTTYILDQRNDLLNEHTMGDAVMD